MSLCKLFILPSLCMMHNGFRLCVRAGFYHCMEYENLTQIYEKASGGIKIADFDKECLKNEWKKEIKEIVVSKKEFKVIDKNLIVEECPWNLPCILESAKPPVSD